MSKKQLSEALREKAQQIPDRDTAELINVLARVVERDERPESWHYGGLLAKAFGAPGDWGYSHPIGKALAAKPD